MNATSKIFIRVIIGCFITLSTNAAGINETFETPESLKSLAKDYVIKNVTLEQDETLDIQISSADMPKLSKCSKNIDVTLPNNVSRERITSLELTCNGDKSWHTYLPLNVQINTKVVVARHPITQDSIITEEDLDYSQADINSTYGGYFKNKSDLVGYVAAQSINPSTIINKRYVHRPQLVHKNQPIDLIAKKNSITVSVKAVSRSDGGLNDSIAAYNPSSKKTIQAIVTGPNRAEVIF